jgi:uncharacterized GH25 family protein
MEEQMKNIFTQRISKVLLLMLFCCPALFAQNNAYNVSFIICDYPHPNIPDYYPGVYEVHTNRVEFIVKEGYNTDELLDKLKNPPYSLIYTCNKYSFRDQNRYVHLIIKGDMENINVLDHYRKFEKEEFFEEAIVLIAYPVFGIGSHGWDIEGQVFYNGKPLSNHLVNVALVDPYEIQFHPNEPEPRFFNSITDEDGKYIVKDIGVFSFYVYNVGYPPIGTLSFKIGNTKYDTTFTFEGKRRDSVPNRWWVYPTCVDINVTSTWKEFEVKGQILQNGEPLIYRTVTLTDQFDFVCSSITDKNGNYTFPYMREDYNYTLSFEIGDTKYDTTFVLDGDMNKDFNIYAPTSDIKGQILKDGKPLSNHTIYTYNEFNLYNSTTDENGNYIFLDMIDKYDYTLFCRVGDNRYDTTFALNDNKIMNFNLVTPSGSGDKFDIRGWISYDDGKPLINHVISLIDAFGVVYSTTTNISGGFVFSEIIDRYNYTLFFEIGNTRYDTTFILDRDKIINFYVRVLDVNEPEEIPTDYSLSQNYPNPFNPTTTIQYSIPKDEFVKLTVYDVTGKVVKELVNGHKVAGKYTVEFNANNYSSGTYYYKIEAGEYKNIQKMMLVK